MDHRHTRLRDSLDRLKLRDCVKATSQHEEESDTARKIREEQERIDADKAAFYATRPDYDALAHARAEQGIEPY